MTRAFKYAADRTLAAVLLLLSSPVLLGLAIWIVVDDGRRH
jgi:lipopolysaccharide/colanic/teichoic acid biosynthesis glycosyltransferase